MFKLENAQIKLNNFVILENVNLKIEKNILNIFIGPNGSGKTSLLNAISGITKISAGKIQNDFKKTILLPQNVTYPEDVTIFEYVSSIFYKSGWKWNLSQEEKKEIDLVLEKLELSSKKNLCLNKLSGGELQLANIALCLVSGSDFILLDEPVSNLDIVNQVKVLEILKQLCLEGITVILVLHDVNLAAKYGEKFIAVTKNKDVFCGNKDEILNTSKLSEIYGINFENLCTILKI